MSLRRRSAGATSELLVWMGQGGKRYTMLLTEMNGTGSDLVTQRIITWLDNTEQFVMMSGIRAHVQPLTFQIPDGWDGEKLFEQRDQLAQELAQGMRCSFRDAQEIIECLGEIYPQGMVWLQ